MLRYYDTIGLLQPALVDQARGHRFYEASQILATGLDRGNTTAPLGHSGGGATTLKHYADPVSEVDRRSARPSRIADHQIRIPDRLTPDLADMRRTRPQSSAAWPLCPGLA